MPPKLPLIHPQPLVRIPEPFNDPAWIFELKLDGFRALAYMENGQCRLVSRTGHVYKDLLRPYGRSSSACIVSVG